jgi:hypothetical protein
MRADSFKHVDKKLKKFRCRDSVNKKELWDRDG